MRAKFVLKLFFAAGLIAVVQTVSPARPAHRRPAPLVRMPVAPVSDLPAAFDYDPGVDYGIANTNTALFAMATTGSVVITPVRQGQILILVPGQHAPGWRYVVDFQTGLVGWVKTARLGMQLTSSRQTPIVFEKHPVPDDKAPQLVLRNDSNIDVRLRLDDKSYVLEPDTIHAVHVSPGIYSYIISVAKRLPQFGTRKFDAGFSYTWSVYENGEPILAPNPQESR